MQYRFPRRLLKSGLKGLFAILRFTTRGKSADQRIAHAWRLVHRLPGPLLVWLYASKYRSHDVNLYHQILKSFRKDGTFTAPSIRIAGEAALRQASRPGHPAVVVTIHTGMVTAIMRALDQLGIPACLIAGHTEKPGERAAYLWGDHRGMDILPADANVFVLARTRVRQGQVICGCIDNFERDAGSGRVIRYAVNRLFEFAKRFRLEIVFGIARITETGEVVVTFSRPEPAGAAPRAVTVTDYVDWLKNEQGFHWDWRVVDRRPGPGPATAG